MSCDSGFGIKQIEPFRIVLTRGTCRSIDSKTYRVILILRIGESIATYALIAVFDCLTFYCVYKTKGNLIHSEALVTDRDGIDGQVGKSIVKTRRVPCRQIV